MSYNVQFFVRIVKIVNEKSYGDIQEAFRSFDRCYQRNIRYINFKIIIFKLLKFLLRAVGNGPSFNIHSDRRIVPVLLMTSTRHFIVGVKLV